MTTSFDKDVDYIIADRDEAPYTEYLVKWKNLPESEASWEHAETLWQFEDHTKRFHDEGATGASHASVGEDPLRQQRLLALT